MAERVSLGSVANDPAESFSSPLNWNRRGVQGAAGEANVCKQKIQRLYCACNVSLQASSVKGSRHPSPYKCCGGKYNVLSCNINQPGWLAGRGAPGERALAAHRRTQLIGWVDRQRSPGKMRREEGKREGDSGLSRGWVGLIRPAHGIHKVEGLKPFTICFY